MTRNARYIKEDSSVYSSSKGHVASSNAVRIIFDSLGADAAADSAANKLLLGVEVKLCKLDVATSRRCVWGTWIGVLGLVGVESKLFNLIAAVANAMELIATAVLIVLITIMIPVRASAFHTMIAKMVIAMIAMVIHMLSMAVYTIEVTALSM